MTLAAGTVLAGYRIASLLGRGGMGEVYLATHEGLGRKVALKLLAPELAADPGFRRRFIAESRLAASLDHPHIVPIYEAGEADGRLFLAMRYVEGADLGAIITRDGPLEPGRGFGLLRGIADALDAAHERGLVHRDVKPANILVARTSRADEHAYLGDFGLVKQLGSDAGFTKSGQLVGSVDYVAPEQIEGRPIDGRVDVYSLACVLYTCLAGRPPYERETEMATLWAHVKADPPRLADIRPELATLDDVIARGMAKDPAERFASAGALLGAAGEAAGIAGRVLTQTVSKADVELPYVGLRAFDEGDARFYVGRESEIETLVNRLRRDRFLAVFGPSGSGKSSLVRAGLIPAIRTGAVRGSSDWSIQVVRPGASPLDALAARIARLRDGATMGATVDELVRDPRALHHATELVLAEAAPTTRLVWVIDQAEELFTLCADEEARRAVIANLVHAATVKGGRTIVVFAMRADFYHRCAAYPELAALVAGGQHLVSPLGVGVLRRTIEEPARSVGLEFEAELVDTILADVADRPGSLPLLEHALFELWDRRRGATLTLSGYRQSGGIAGAIAVRSEATYGDLEPAEQVIARRIFLRLVQPGEGAEDTRRRAALDELSSGAEGEATLRVVEALAEARLVNLGTSEDTSEPVIDLAHEALLRAWPRLRTWIDDDREALRMSRRIADAAGEWERLDREDDALMRGARLEGASEFLERYESLLTGSERGFVEASVAERAQQSKRAQRRRRAAFGIAASIAAFFIGLAGLSGTLWVQSEGARRAAVAAELEAGKQRAEAETQRNDAERARIEALGRQLVAQSLAAGESLDLSILLALEGLKRFETPEAWDTLARALNSRPEVETLRRLPNPATEIAASLDGQVVGLTQQAGHGREELSVYTVDPWTRRHGPIPVLDSTYTRWDIVGSTQTHVTFSDDGRSIGYAAIDGRMAVLDLATGGIITSIAPADAQIDSVAWDPGSRILRWVGHSLLDDDQPVLSSWDTKSGELSSTSVRGPNSDSPARRQAYLAPGGAYVATVVSTERSAETHVFNAVSGVSIGRLAGAVAGFGVDGRSLVSGQEDGRKIRQLPDLSDISGAIPLGVEVVWAVVDAPPGQVTTWSLSGRRSSYVYGGGVRVVNEAGGGDDHIGAMTFVKNGRRGFVGRGREIEVLDLGRDGALQTTKVSVEIPTRGLVGAVSLDGRIVAQWSKDPGVAGAPYVVAVTDVASGRLLSELDVEVGDELIAAALSADGLALLTVDLQGSLRSWPVDGGASELLASFGMLDANIPGDLIVSRDGTKFALVTFDRTLALSADGTLTKVIGGNDGVFVDASSELLIAACDEGEGVTGGKIVSIDMTGSAASQEILIDGCPRQLDVNLDSSMLLTTIDFSGFPYAGALDVFDLRRRVRLGRVATGLDFVGAVRFGQGADADTALTAKFVAGVFPRNADPFDVVRFQRWDVSPASWRTKACKLVARNLTNEEWDRYLGDEVHGATCPDYPTPKS